MSSRASGRFGKESDKLARDVRAQGYKAECLDGHTFLVWKKGEARILCRFNAHPRNEAVLMQARRDLRKLGVLPGIGGAKKNETKEYVVATVAEENKTRTEDLVLRIRKHLEDLGGDTVESRRALAERAVGIIQFRHDNGMSDVEQFGSTGAGKSPPVDIARESLRGLLDRSMAGTDKSLARWSTVLGEIESGNNNHVRVEEPPEPEQPQDLEPEQPQDSPGELEALRERAELAESVVADIERERDLAREAAASAIEGRNDATRDLVEHRKRLRDSESDREALVREVEELRASAISGEQGSEEIERLRGEVKRLNQVVRGQKGGQARGQKQASRRIEELLVELDTARAENASLSAHLDAVLATDDSADSVMVFRQRYFEEVLALLRRTPSDDTPQEWMLNVLGTLAGLGG